MSDTMDAAIISILAILSSVFMNFLLGKFGISARMKEIQSFTGSVNKEYFNALRKKDTKKLDELDVKMKESQKMSMESLVLQLKSMLIIFPIFLGVPYIVQNILYPIFTITLPFQVPIPFRPTFFEITWRDTFGAYGWFILSFVILGALTQLILSEYRKRTQKSGADAKKDEIQKK